MKANTVVIGVDGCAAGWMVAARERSSSAVSVEIFSDFRAILSRFDDRAVIAVDMPIGLMDAAQPGGRDCETIARTYLKPCGSRVFASPVFKALAYPNHSLASDENARSSYHALGISIQCFGLFPKLKEMHQLMTPQLQKRVVETHPELSFRQMNGGNPVLDTKRTPQGRQKRIDLLAAHGITGVEVWFSRFKRADAKPDDILDAFACCWTAGRYSHGEAVQIPAHPPADSRGLRMEMWF